MFKKVWQKLMLYLLLVTGMSFMEMNTGIPLYKVCDTPCDSNGSLLEQASRGIHEIHKIACNLFLKLIALGSLSTVHEINRPESCQIYARHVTRFLQQDGLQNG